MSALGDRLRSPRRWLLGAGSLTLAALFLVRASTPVADPLLLAIFVALLCATVGLIAGSRLAAGIVLLLTLALFQPITAREFSFSLDAVDSSAWRAWAIASILAIGWSIVAAIVVLVHGSRTGDQHRWHLGAQVAGGVVLGLVLLAVFPALAPQPAFGRGLDRAQIDDLPVIELVNYRYEPVVVTAGDGGLYRARLDNSSDLPHTFTIEAIDLEIFVPAGRWAILELDPDDLAAAPLAVICTIGDHLSLGMAGTVEVADR